MKAAKNVESSAAELSSRNQSLLGLYSAEVETAADKIILASSSPATRRQALVWKAEAIPALQQSLLNFDPVTAVMDTWAFLFQMTAYVEQPAAKQGFGDSYSLVAETLKTMQAQMEQLIQVAAPSANLPALRQYAASWAASHPLQAGLAGRQSLDPERIRQLGQADLGTMASVRSLEESLGDLTARMDSYNAYLPKQARWQAELLLSDLARGPEFGAAASNFATLSDALAKTSGTMEKMPDLVQQTQKALEVQRLAAQDFMRQELLQASNMLKQERVGLAGDVLRERLAATADLRSERHIVLQALHDERIAAVNDVRGASEKTLQDFDSKARSLINHFFLYALGLMLLTLVLCSLVAWLLLRRFAGTRLDPGQARFDRAA
jgi:hypothetical protein